MQLYIKIIPQLFFNMNYTVYSWEWILKSIKETVKGEECGKIPEERKMLEYYILFPI